ncbi:SAV0927 family protein [Virgibacillus sp. Bac330]|nr:SAV0927 family protein [Virgibacillus sp. Bac330]
MMGKNYEVIKDETVGKDVRYVSFMGQLQRYDLAILDDHEDVNKKLIINMRKNRCLSIDKQDLHNKGVIEHTFNEANMEADEIRHFLQDIL